MLGAMPMPEPKKLEVQASLKVNHIFTRSPKRSKQTLTYANQSSKISPFGRPSSSRDHQPFTRGGSSSPCGRSQWYNVIHGVIPASIKPSRRSL